MQNMNLQFLKTHGLSLIQLQVFWNYPHFPSIANGAALLRSSRFIVCYTILLLMISLLKGTGAFCSGNLQVHVCAIILVVLTALIS